MLLPLDVAAHTRVLRFYHGTSGEQGVQRAAELGAIAGLPITGCAGVKASMIAQGPPRVIDIELGCAGGLEGTCRFLRGIVEDGERNDVISRHSREIFRRVVGVACGVVRTDADESCATGEVIRGKAKDFGQNMDDIRAMAAEKNNNQKRRSGKIFCCDSVARGDIGQGELGQKNIRSKGRAAGQSHDSNVCRR